MSESENVKSHPAKFSPQILQVLDGWLHMEAFWLNKRTDKLRVLDPMCGVGGVHSLPGRTFGVELEEEWASQHPRSQQGDCRALPWRAKSFDAIVVSPVYGNRLSDAYNAKDDSKRISYHFYLGRKPTHGSSAVMQWPSQAYKDFHEEAWEESLRVLRPGGLMAINISDHIRGGERQHVSAWHCNTLEKLGLVCFARRDVPTPRMRFGQNHEARVECEHIFAFRKLS
jgi:hypothetical protein